MTWAEHDGRRTSALCSLDLGSIDGTVAVDLLLRFTPPSYTLLLSDQPTRASCPVFLNIHVFRYSTTLSRPDSPGLAWQGHSGGPPPPPPTLPPAQPTRCVTPPGLLLPRASPPEVCNRPQARGVPAPWSALWDGMSLKPDVMQP
ncbi:uncharacterized protein THITE_156381 [Thermothielavioides terrestris NRRL 8126]|uniref:Uncharacterized protein n=1 Tax=Thermothielavioides terrestris (strain ATCC 38088 / NRRL 8126) TaxID=578455 RepID=G2RAJ1_THETT|nr:uncharacterized protein THITE_156381 [Thermothielavioides terrestris NRRL 8126]AEO69726.1 hypothetical protein THITE_156381 [Thermothielavioides terrestris NRRL 8126]